MKHSADGRPSTTSKRAVKLALQGTSLGLVSLLSVACSALPQSPNEPTAEQPIDAPAFQEITANSAEPVENKAGSKNPDEQILDNLLDALVQLREPLNTTVQVSVNDASQNQQQLTDALARRGYGIQRVEADLGANLLQWSRNPETGAAENAPVEWSVTIGTQGVSRSYEVSRANQIAPASTMMLWGTRKLIKLDDAMFANAEGQTSPFSTIEFASADSMLENLPTISLITDDVIQGVSQRAVNGANARALNSSKLEVNNLFASDAIDGYGGVSAFTQIRDDYERIKGETVIFADDSLRLGPQGKQQVEAFLKEFQPNVDLIGLIGCSNGPTKLDIGNQGLALGRSQRVAEELLTLGVPRESILDEGCWSETSAGGRFPSRGVVIELLRRPLG